MTKILDAFTGEMIEPDFSGFRFAREFAPIPQEPAPADCWECVTPADVAPSDAALQDIVERLMAANPHCFEAKRYSVRMPAPRRYTGEMVTLAEYDRRDAEAAKQPRSVAAQQADTFSAYKAARLRGWGKGK